MWVSSTKESPLELESFSTAMGTGRRSSWRLAFVMAGRRKKGDHHGGWPSTWQVGVRKEIIMEAGLRHGR